jgi:hypothetical protein
MKINIQELEESRKVKLVSDIVSGKISHKDVLYGNVEFCDSCDGWETLTSLTECSFLRAWISINGSWVADLVGRRRVSIGEIEPDLEKDTND